MKKIFLFLFYVSFFALTTEAQVTIGSTNPPQTGSILDLQSQSLGFLPPRVDLVNPHNPSPLTGHVAGMVVYNKKEPSATDTLQVGLYYNTGVKWIRLFASNTETKAWFYMPSIVLETAHADPNNVFTVNLFEKFKEQKLTAGPNIKFSNGAPDKPFSKSMAASDFYYYVTAYDATVFKDIVINAAGVLTYKVDPANPVTDQTFMNIVFVEK